MRAQQRHTALPLLRPRARRFVEAAFVFIGCLAFFSLGRTAPIDAEWDWGPFTSRLRDVHGVVRWRAAGPLFECADDEEGRHLTAIRPFFADAGDSVTGWTRREILWPLAAGKRLEKELTWRLALTWYQNFNTEDPRSRRRLWVVPFYFQGRDGQGRSYVAVFPLGGQIREFFMLDRIDFALFPLWVRSKKNEVYSTTLLWPIFSRTRGKGIYRIRAFPVFGRSMFRDHYEKKFVLWPLYTEARYHYPSSSGRGFILLPLYGRIRLTDQRADLLLLPFFRYTRGARQNMVHAPWPFVQIGWGETRRTYLWPLYGRQRRPGVQNEFFLWPIGYRERVDRPDTVFRRWMLLPFVQAERETLRRPPPGIEPVRNRYWRVWPFFSYERQGAEARWRILALMPFRDPPPVERNWTPLWTLFERTTLADHSDTELLWGLFRRQYRGAEGARTSLFPLIEWSVRHPAAEAAPTVRSWSLLKGFLGIESCGAQRRLRVLYFFRLRWGRTDETS